jgi:hypothetical protein
VGGEVDEVSVSLRFFGPLLDPGEITQALGCEPSQVRRRGEIVEHAFAGQSVIETSAWILKSPRAAAAPLGFEIQKLLARLSGDLGMWQSLTNRHKADLFCGLFLEEFNRGTTVSAEVLGLLADRGLALTLDIYSELSGESA